MNFSLNDKEVKEAVQEYIIAQGFNTEDKDVSIKFKTTRKGDDAGTAAEVTITDKIVVESSDEALFPA